MDAQSHVVQSADGVPIHYGVRGKGTPALVFVHGWCCDRRYWDRQVDHFGPHYTVVTLDLAGHGASGTNRAQWTMETFGQDVAAVVEQLGLEQVVLIGHSMGGAVIVEAARRLPAAVTGLVGADTWHDLDHAPTPAQVTEAVAPFRADFVGRMRALARNLFVPTSDPALVEDIVAGMSAAPPDIGVAAWEELVAYEIVRAERLREIPARKVLINSTHPLATNMEAARRCGIEVMLMSGVGHFSMLEDPQTFNHLLDEALGKLVPPGAA